MDTFKTIALIKALGGSGDSGSGDHQGILITTLVRDGKTTFAVDKTYAEIFAALEGGIICMGIRQDNGCSFFWRIKNEDGEPLTGTEIYVQPGANDVLLYEYTLTSSNVCEAQVLKLATVESP